MGFIEKNFTFSIVQSLNRIRKAHTSLSNQPFIFGRVKRKIHIRNIPYCIDNVNTLSKKIGHFGQQPLASAPLFSKLRV